MTDLLEYTGTLSDITYRTTRQGRHWVTANLAHDGGVSEICIYPNAYEELRGGIREHVEATVSVRVPAAVAAMKVGGLSWEEGPLSDDTGKTPQAILAGLNLPWGPDPVPLPQVFKAIQRDCPDWFEARFGREALHGPAMVRLVLFFAQGHHLQHFRKPLFPEALYAAEDGIQVDLPEPSGEFPTNAQWLTIGSAVSRYGRMEPCDLRSLVRASGAWQSAIEDLRAGGDGVIDLGLLAEWFDRDEERDDAASLRPTKAEMVEASAYLAAKQADRD